MFGRPYAAACGEEPPYAPPRTLSWPIAIALMIRALWLSSSLEGRQLEETDLTHVKRVSCAVTPVSKVLNVTMCHEISSPALVSDQNSSYP
jgi:hypothetical protein